jgi:hypothetical protein
MEVDPVFAPLYGEMFEGAGASNVKDPNFVFRSVVTVRWTSRDFELPDEVKHRMFESVTHVVVEQKVAEIMIVGVVSDGAKLKPKNVRSALPNNGELGGPKNETTGES